MQNTITEVLAPYLNRLHNIHADNFDNSEDLAKDLYYVETRTCGFVGINGGLPVILEQTKLNANKCIYRRKGQMRLKMWKPNKDKKVMTISSIEFHPLSGKLFLNTLMVVNALRNIKGKLLINVC